MGAHSLGQASKANSGYQGIWTPGQMLVLNSDYYRAMIDPKIHWVSKVIWQKKPLDIKRRAVFELEGLKGSLCATASLGIIERSWKQMGSFDARA